MNQEQLKIFNKKFQGFVAKYNALEQQQHYMQGKFNLSAAEIHTIVKIYSVEGINLINLAALQAVSRSAITQMINKLIKKEMVYKKKMLGAKNEYALYLTAEGKEVVSLHKAQHAHLNREILSVLNEYPEATLAAIQDIMAAMEKIWTEIPEA